MVELKVTGAGEAMSGYVVRGYFDGRGAALGGEVVRAGKRAKDPARPMMRAARTGPAPGSRGGDGSS